MDVRQRFEAKHLQLTLALAVDALRFAPERAAAYSGPGGYSNRLTGQGITPADVDAAIAFFDAYGEDTKLEVADDASTELLDAIGERGFRPRFFTHVLARAPKAGAIRADIQRLDRTDAAAVREVALHNECWFASALAPPGEITIGLTEKHLRMPTNDTLFVREEGGAIVAAALSESSEGTTLLFGGAVKPEYRGRGYQRALLDARLAVAAERGSDLAVVMVGPNTTSARNVERAGFSLAYARAFFLRPARPSGVPR